MSSTATRAATIRPSLATNRAQLYNKASTKEKRLGTAAKALERRRWGRGKERLGVMGEGVEAQTKMQFDYSEVQIETEPGVSIFDVTPEIRRRVEVLGIQEGTVHVLSRHTTTAITINENEKRLFEDVRVFLEKLAPPDELYMHNDLHKRESPADWPGGRKAWILQEPENAHSHLLSMMLGNSESIPVSKGQLMLGQWQSVLLVELDGPRSRTMGVQVVGHV